MEKCQALLQSTMTQEDFSMKLKRNHRKFLQSDHQNLLSNLTRQHKHLVFLTHQNKIPCPTEAQELKEPVGLSGDRYYRLVGREWFRLRRYWYWTADYRQHSISRCNCYCFDCCCGNVFGNVCKTSDLLLKW